MKYILIIASVVFSSLPANAQNKMLYNPPNGVTVKEGRVLAGPDPTIEQNLFGMLADKTVRQEIGFVDLQNEAYENLMKSALSIPREIERDPTATAAFRANRQALILESLREILRPSQVDRLKALAYRYEVSAVGLPEALTRGRLSDAVGVHVNQHERILRKGAEIDAQLQKDIRELRRKAEEQLLDELSPEQQRKVTEVLGDFFQHQDVLGASALYHEVLERNKKQSESEGRKSK